MNKKGFTLIELLVVIAIIGLLSTLAVVALGSARAKARDAKRLSDVKQLQTALEIYFNDNNAYPISATAAVLGSTNLSCLGATPPGFAAAGACGAGAPMGLVPVDPLTSQTYTYQTDATGTTYTIVATLEGTNGQYHDVVHATPSGLVNFP